MIIKKRNVPLDFTLMLVVAIDNFSELKKHYLISLCNANTII
ncbi:hypothetical protein EDC24_1617 [Aquisalibacillus elongatus]|uniref:Uncharacterized protein n=1 Tax=Aquisalibacillus elongatus TaxID=485577 RepID=A0A3N5BXB4_9BACI|nr:hypothetical protein EDC24_1617 [Aquisalibacillus elongatus]